ncbi:MAG: DUF1295 domain-containing protein [Pseudomonadota bacterium]|nr:DUF1295 domain-containing protein [Pseudomonadota bacterium]
MINSNLDYSSFLAVAAVSVMVMLGAYTYAQKQQRAGIVDACWALLIAAGSLVFAVVHEGDFLLRTFIGIGSTLWFLRLGWHLLIRYQHEEQEDSRYANMRQALGDKAAIGFLLFFLFQAGLVMLFLVPMWAITQLPLSQHSVVILAAALMLVAFWGEHIADKQLSQFKSKPENKGKVMDQGLWKYSRHPNYFFEWLHWFAYPLIGLASGQYWLWFYPLLMFAFLYFISGIPFSEKQARKSKGEAYRRYQERTSVFILWPPNTWPNKTSKS